MESTAVRLTRGSGRATITLAVPERRNALSAQLVSELSAALDAAAEDPALRVVILAADGPVFCAGGDLSEASRGDTHGPGEALVGVLRRLLSLPQPVVARVHGPVRAGGIGIIGACDVAIGVPEATFAFTEARLGLTPAIISLTTLPQLSERAASELFLTGRTVDGEAAARLGLLTSCVPAEQLDAKVEEAVEQLQQASPQGLRETKQLLRSTQLATLERDAPGLVELSARLFASPEAKESMRAFLERRAPAWRVEGSDDS